jgi:glucosamine-6-phosphate deaminase
VTWSLTVHPAEAWADAVAADLIDRLRAEPGLRVVLPTGDTPTPVYAALVRRSPPRLWAAATIVLLDDYLGLDAASPAAGASRLRRELVDRVAPGRFVTIDAATADPAAAALAHDAVAADGIDLALVGLGMNGHVGFNEPGSGPHAPTRVVELHARSRRAAVGYGARSAPDRGITVGLARLLEARELWLLVSGVRKAEILRAAVEGPETPQVPASFLRRHERCRIVIDEPAGSLLGG